MDNILSNSLTARLTAQATAEFSLFEERPNLVISSFLNALTAQFFADATTPIQELSKY